MQKNISYKDMLNVKPTIEHLKAEKLPVKVAYALDVNFRRVEDALEAYELTRLGMVQKYGAPTENGFQVTQANSIIFELELRELQRQQVELNVHVIDRSLLEELDLLRLGDWMSLYFIINEETE